MKNPFADNRCKILSKHFCVGLCRNVNYIVNIIEKLSGSGRNDNGIHIPGRISSEQNNFLDFLHRDSYQRQLASKGTAVGWVRPSVLSHIQTCLNLSGMTLVGLGVIWPHLRLLKMKIIKC